MGREESYLGDIDYTSGEYWGKGAAMTLRLVVSHRSISNAPSDTGRRRTFPRLPPISYRDSLGWWEAQLPFTCFQLLLFLTTDPMTPTSTQL